MRFLLFEPVTQFCEIVTSFIDTLMKQTKKNVQFTYLRFTICPNTHVCFISSFVRQPMDEGLS